MYEKDVYYFRHKDGYKKRKNLPADQVSLELVRQRTFKGRVRDNQILGSFNQREKAELEVQLGIKFPFTDKTLGLTTNWTDRITSIAEEWGIGKMY